MRQCFITFPTYTVGPRLSVPLLHPDFLIIWTLSQSQFCHEYLLVMINIFSNILFKAIALKNAVKSIGLVTNEENSDEF